MKEFTDKFIYIYGFLREYLAFQTDTASVLHEAIEYIKFLHDQVNVSITFAFSENTFFVA